MDLIERLRDGCVLRPERWIIDEAATDALMAEAADALEAAREVVCWQRRVLLREGHWGQWEQYHDLHDEGRPEKVGRFKCQYRPLYAHPSPSAPVGVEAGEAEERVPALTTLRFLPDGIVQMDNADFEKLRTTAALAQQPAAAAQPVAKVIKTTSMGPIIEWYDNQPTGTELHTAPQPAAVDGARVGRAVDAFKRALPAGEAFKLASIPHLALNHAMRAALAAQPQGDSHD